MTKPFTASGWKKSEEYQYSKQSQFVKIMTEETLALPRPPKPIPTTDQAPSTIAALKAQTLRDPKEDVNHLLRPMPPCVAKLDAKDLFSLVGAPETFGEWMKRIDTPPPKRGFTTGTLDISSLTTERRNRGIEAFTYSPPAKLTEAELKRVTKLTEMKSEMLEPKKEEPSRSTLSKLFGWLKPWPDFPYYNREK